MSQTQLELPALTDEESTVVDRFRERSQDIVPGVEVTLAKRILKPGSNRIVCLAARTCVPLKDDELASVSDLALRLSDGTNVVLSLSFFNDTVAGGSIPFTRSTSDANRYTYDPGRNTYDPDRYTIRSDSKLGVVLFAMGLIALAGYYSLTNGPFSKYFSTKPLANSALVGVGSSLIKAIPVNPIVSPPKTPTVAPVNSSPKEHASTVIKGTPRATTRHSWRARERHNADRWRAPGYAHEPKEEMLVPPPPATYVAPYGLPAQFFEQFPGFYPSPKATKPTSKVEPKEARPTTKAEPKSETKPEPKIEIKPGPRVVPKSEPKAEIEPKAAPKSEPRAGIKPEPKAVPKSEAKAEIKPEAKAVPKAESKPVAKVESKSEFQAVPTEEPEAIPSSSATSTYSRTIWEAPKVKREALRENDATSHQSAPPPGTETTMPLERIVPPTR